jgi:hypothetical protein
MAKISNAVLLLVLSLLFSCAIGCAGSRGLAVSGKAGTLGLGGDLTAGITSNVNARVGINAGSLSFQGTPEDVEYDVDLDFLSFPALVDWHVFDDSFRISAGVLINQNEIGLLAIPTSPVNIGGIEYTPAEIGTLSGGVDFEPVAPYIGIGWGNALDPYKKWGFTCDFGVAYTHSPNVALTANGTAASDPTFQDALEREVNAIEDKLSNYKFYPVISIGLYYRF